jgi:hypothetical protein
MSEGRVGSNSTYSLALATSCSTGALLTGRRTEGSSSGGPAGGGRCSSSEYRECGAGRLFVQLVGHLLILQEDEADVLADKLLADPVMIVSLQHVHRDAALHAPLQQDEPGSRQLLCCSSTV